MADDTVEVVPISPVRVKGCYESARFWVRELPVYADRNQRLADGWALAAGIVSAVTATTVIPFDNALATAVLALAGGILALVPRIYGFGERAGAARELTSRYGSVLGDLLDLTEADPFPAESALAVVTRFEEAKASKDGLRGLPDRNTVQLRRLEAEIKLADAQSRVAEVRRKAAAAKEQSSS